MVALNQSLLELSTHFNKGRCVVVGSDGVEVQLLKLRRCCVSVKTRERIKDNVLCARLVVTIKVKLLKEHASTDEAKVQSISALSVH